MQMNVQLHHVVSDITGRTGMRIIRAIAAGSHVPEELAAYRDARCRASEATICAALTGHYRPEHVFALRQGLELYDFHQAKIAECDAEIETTLRQLSETRPAPSAPLPAVRHAKGQHQLTFDARAALYALLGADLTQIHGFGPYTVLRLVAECGDDMKQMVDGQALHVLAGARSWEQGVGRTPAELQDQALGQPCRGAVAPGGGERRTNADCPRRLLSASRCAHWQGEGRHGHRAKACGPVLHGTSVRHEVR